MASSFRARPLTPPPTPQELDALDSEFGAAEVYEVAVFEPGTVSTRPVPVGRGGFQQALARLSREIRREAPPREAARALLEAELEMEGVWLAEVYRGRVFTLVPQEDTGLLTPAEEEALREEYLGHCEGRGGGDCLGLFTDGPYLRTDDRRTLALALSLGPVLEESRAALARELDSQAVMASLVWAISLYCAMWLVPEPTTKAAAAVLSVLLVAWLGVDTVWALMDGWAKLATRAHRARSFAELRAAGEEYGKVLGTEAARALILAVATLSGRTLGEVAAKVRTLPGYSLAAAQWEAQGGAAVLGRVRAVEVVAQEGALATAVATVETVVATPHGAIAVAMLKKRAGGGGTAASGGGSSVRVALRHRAGNWQVLFGNGQRWHLPRGASPRDIPAKDEVGDRLQEAVSQAAREWGPRWLSFKERDAIEKAREKGEHWLAHLLEREARGRFVEKRVGDQFKHLYDFSRNRGVDVIDPATGYRYEILSGTQSNLARHGRRMAGELFRMLTF